MCCVLCCVVVWCGVVCVWCGLCVWRFCVVFLLFLSILFFLFLTLSLSFSLLSFFSLLSSLLFSLPRFLFSSLHATKHCGKNRSTNTAANWRTASAQQSVLSPPSLHSLLPSQKNKGTFYYRNISGEEFIFYYSFKLIPKTRRRGKLQTLQFYIKSKTINLQRVKSVIIFGEMVSLVISMKKWD